MPVIVLETKISADIEICFDLSRSIDLHQISTRDTDEKAIAGVTKGLIGFEQTVTWQAVHFGVRQKLTSKITEFSRPSHFRDEQQSGAFRFIIHDHYFEEHRGGVLMTDIFHFKSPLGLLGAVADKLFLTRYMKRLLETRNAVIKDYAENEKGKIVLETQLP